MKMSNEEGISNINFINFTDDEVASVSNEDVERPATKNPPPTSSFRQRLFKDNVVRRQIGIVVGIVVVATFIAIVIGVTLASHSANLKQSESENQSEIEIGGSYILNSFDEKFEDYLVSLGVPKFVVHLIKETKEMVTVTEPTNTNPNWTLVMTTEFSTHKVEFQIGKRFEQRLSGRNMIEHLCLRPEHHILVCTTKEFVKNWNLQSRLIFSKDGMTDEKTNLNMNISTNKTYLRLSRYEIDSDGRGISSGPTTQIPPNPFEDEDSFSWD